MQNQNRVFLFLQGPTGPFFRNFGRELLDLGHNVIRVNFCGGDFVDWHGPETVNYFGRYRRWPSWVASLMDRERVTDLVVLADYRARHLEAVEIARVKGIRIFVFEEGYLRPYYVTLEEGGVNGNSRLPRDPEAMRKAAAVLPESTEPQVFPNKTKLLIRHTVQHLAGRFLLFPMYPCYSDYRAYNIFREYALGWVPQLLRKKKRNARTAENMRRLQESGMPYYLFPLQLDTDAQVRLFSPFSGMREGISRIMASFARHAPKGTALLVKNHPLDCGLINYYRYVREYAKALGIDDRVFFFEYGDNQELIAHSTALVMLNSSYGTMALSMGKPVYFLGRGICSVEGLGACEPEVKLDDFWHAPLGPKPEVLADFLKVLRASALLNGDFLTPEGQKMAIAGALRKMGVACAN